jgi:hypothetical protein
MHMRNSALERLGEIPMGQTTNTTQVYSPFGSGYVPEAHDPNRLEKPKPFHRRRGAVLLAFLLAVSTAAGAIAGLHRAMQPDEIWAQETPSSVLKLPGGFGVDDAVY